MINKECHGYHLLTPMRTPSSGCARVLGDGSCQRSSETLRTAVSRLQSISCVIVKEASPLLLLRLMMAPMAAVCCFSSLSVGSSSASSARKELSSVQAGRPRRRDRYRSVKLSRNQNVLGLTRVAGFDVGSADRIGLSPGLSMPMS